MSMLGNFLNTLIDILYPPTCLICKSRLKRETSVDNFVCRDCWGKIKRNLPPFCYRCGRHLETTKFTPHLHADAGSTKNICPNCIRNPLYFDRAFSPCLYEGTIKELIHNFKYKNKDYLGLTLSRLMIEFIKEYNLPIKAIDYIIALPLHKVRLREREFNQAQILSNYIASEFNKVVLNDNLIRWRPTKSQTELKEEKRLLNVKDSFLVTEKEKIKGKNILLVDDVLTTAATASEAACVLKNAGAGIVFVLTLAS